MQSALEYKQNDIHHISMSVQKSMVPANLSQPKSIMQAYICFIFYATENKHSKAINRKRP